MVSQKKDIDKWSLNYSLLKAFAVGIFYNHYYRKRIIVNRNKIPGEAPVILAPNHQNALMDALAIVGIPMLQPVFLARSDVFKGKFIIWFLTGCKILPIYRIRDGRSNLQKNDEVFDATDNVMQNHRNPLAIFPEGNHGDRRRLRPLVKGIFRIAFRAQEKYGSKPGVKIVPTGIDYSHYWKIRSDQLVYFGDPIEVSEYWNDFVDNPSVATNKLRRRLSDEMKKVMINIETEEYYDLYMGLRELYRPVMLKRLLLKSGDLYNRFKADKKIIATLDTILEKQPDKIQKLDYSYKNYVKLREKLRSFDCAVKPGPGIAISLFKLLISLPGLPIAIVGFVNNAPQLLLSKRFAKGIKDTQFYCTAYYGIGLVIMTVYTLILFIMGLILLPLWWIAVLYLPVILYSGLFMLAYRRFYIRTWKRVRFLWGVKRKNYETYKMQTYYNDVMEQMDSIMQSVN